MQRHQPNSIPRVLRMRSHLDVVLTFQACREKIHLTLGLIQRYRGSQPGNHLQLPGIPRWVRDQWQR